MPGRTMLCLGVTLLLSAPYVARAQHHMHGGGGGHHPGGGGGAIAAVGGYPGFFLMPFYGTIGPAGVAYYPGLVMGPSAFGVGPFMPVQFPPAWGRGPRLPAPPPEIAARWPKPSTKAARTPSDPKRAAQLMTIGDRLFRAGNLKKAEERYQQAIRASADLAAPYIHLAQIAIVRGNYGLAANRLREAETAQPGWLETARDIQAIYGEPAQFARQISRLESHVQVYPDDRDAWLVLGAQWFLSGRTARAADVFLRLDDPRRKADSTLAAFLDASNQARPPADDEGDARK